MSLCDRCGVDIEQANAEPDPDDMDYIIEEQVDWKLLSVRLFSLVLFAALVLALILGVIWGWRHL